MKALPEVRMVSYSHLLYKIFVLIKKRCLFFVWLVFVGDSEDQARVGLRVRGEYGRDMGVSAQSRPAVPRCLCADRTRH